MAVSGWIVDKSAAVRAIDPVVGQELEELAGSLYICPIGELEQLHSARSATEYDAMKANLHASVEVIDAPADVFDRALALQQELAHYHGMWHRTPIPDLLIAETAVSNNLGVVHVNADFERIAEVRPLVVRRLA